MHTDLMPDTTKPLLTGMAAKILSPSPPELVFFPAQALGRSLLLPSV